MTTLFLAEGDFSYAESQSSRSPLVACGYDLEIDATKKYGRSFEKRLSKMKAMKGVTVAFNVDATKTLFKGALPSDASNINEIEIRYPHTGIKSVASNRILLTSMITQCTRLMKSQLCKDGCTLSISLKTTGRYNEWAGDIRSIARTENLSLISVSRPTNPTGYKHVTTTGHDAGVQQDQAATWVFQRIESCNEPLRELPEWLTSEIGERCEKCEACDKIFSSSDDLETHLSGKGHKRKLMAMNSAGGRRKLKREREKAVKDELRQKEIDRPDRPKSKKELRKERKKQKLA